MLTLEKQNIELIKDGRKYFLSGDLSVLEESQSTEEVSASQRLVLISYLLLTSAEPIINEELQERFWVSNVTVIQDVAEIEKRLKEFELSIQRKRGYQVVGATAQKRRFLAILLSNAISIQNFWQDDYPEFPILESEQVQAARQIFEEHQYLLGEVDSKLRQFLMILLALADNQAELVPAVNVSKEALDFSKRIFSDLAKRSKKFFNLQEIVYFANILDEIIIKRQEIPLFREKFDSEFYYSISQMVDAVSRCIFSDLAKRSKKFFNLQEIVYFANILDEIIIKRQEIPLFREKFDSEFYYSISQMVDAVSRFTKIDFFKDKLLFQLLFNHMRLSLAVPFLFPERATTNVAYLAAQKNQFLHSIVSLVMRDIFPSFIQNEYEYELVTLHFASILRNFSLSILNNQPTFEDSVGQIVERLDFVTDVGYLVHKLLSRFELSPLAIPNTNLALLHTQSHTVTESHFLVVELSHPVSALSMNHQYEQVQRILVMLTKVDDEEEIREMMTAISQSIIENNLYTEIYRTGNQEIIYQLLNAIFTEKIKKLEN